MKVILIVADTFRRDHLGTYGNNWIHTPNIDRLAAEATVFENHYIGSFPTLPNRRDVLLGTGDKGTPFNRWRGIDDDEVTVSERLREEQAIPSMMVTGVANSVTGGINMYKGFDAWAFNRGQEGDPCWLNDNVALEFPVEHKYIRYPAQRWHQVLINRADRRIEEDWFAPGTYRMAIQWLQQNYTRDDFFLYIDSFDPHEPWDPPKWYEHLYDSDFTGRRFDAPTYGVVDEMGYTAREVQNIRARYAGEVTMVDACVGRLLATLSQLDIYDETMIIFTSDHGAYFDYPGDGGLICKPFCVGADGMIMSAGKPTKEPMRYFPHFTGVCRIPLILRQPGQTEGQRTVAITQPWDITPTLLEAFDISKPPELWGHSLLSVATGSEQSTREAAVMGHSATHAQAVTPRWLYAIWRGQRPKVLYDLQADPQQSKDVSSECPEVVEQLHQQIVTYLRRQGLDELVEEYQ